MFNNLRELILSMPTEKACREYLAKYDNTALSLLKR